MSPMIGRAIGVLVLCLLVGLFLAHLGIAARGILTYLAHYSLGRPPRRRRDHVALP